MTALAQLIALVLWAEARGEGDVGMRAVASVVHCRASGDPRFCGLVVTQRAQFSCYPSCQELRPWAATGPDAEAWRLARQIADEMVNGVFSPTVQATHYHAVGVHPRWARKMVRVGSVGRHVFYLDTKARKPK